MNRFDTQQRTLEYLYDWQSDYLNDYDVKFYFLDITVSNTSTYIEGNTTINALAVTVVDTFAFELIPLMTISQVIINDVDYTDVFYREGASNNVLVPIEEIAEGDMISAQIFYSGTPDGGSFFVGVDNDYSPAWQKYMTWTLSEPFAASDWFAVKQDLEDKADSCWVFLTTNSENMAGSQGVLTDVVDLGDGNTRYEWKSNYPIAYYLISFAVSEYQDYSIYAFPEQMAGDSILIQNFIYDSPGCLEYYQDNIDVTPEMIELLSDLYILYPFSEEKYGHCLTRLGGGMEHQTMTTIGGFSFGLVAHELGHMWFGDNVTCATWSDIWINEGFATYSDYLCRYYLQSPSAGTSFMIDTQNDVMDVAGGSTYIPESQIYPGNEWRIFDGRLSYDKGAAIIHTLRHEIQNDNLFFEVMETFQTQFTDSTATGDDFKEVAESVTGMDFDPFFDQWYYGEGYPIYDFEWYATDNGYFHLTSTQSTSSITPLFEMLMDFKLVFMDGSDTIISLYQTDNLNEFEVYLGKKVAAVQVDPNNWTMEKTNSLVVGMKETDKQVYFTIGPNPVNDYLNVYFLNPSNEMKEVSVSDISGKIILQTNTNNQQLRLNTSSLNNGVYIVSVTDGKDVLVKRFIK
jgi:aminopeptidase N